MAVNKRIVMQKIWAVLPVFQIGNLFYKYIFHAIHKIYKKIQSLEHNHKAVYGN